MQQNNQPIVIQYKPKKKFYQKWWFLILVIFFGIATISSSTKTSITNKKSENQASSAQEVKQQEQIKLQERQTAIDTYAPIYCVNQQKIVINEPQLLAQGWPNADGNHGVTNEECVTIITKLYDYLVDYAKVSSRLKSISERKVFIGMEKLELIYSWGEPNDINKTTYSGGTSEQWVYGNPIYNATYVYLENDIVTSMQD